MLVNVLVLKTTYTPPTITVYESGIFPDSILCGKDMTREPAGTESTLPTTFIVMGSDYTSYLGDTESRVSWMVFE
jgi:hypothetical protein